MSQRRILVTSALPYANGHIHIGHLVEYIQTDIWVRFQKLRGHECLYICADDTHGTAIMNRARQEGRPEQEVIAEMQQAHIQDFASFLIEFDHYGSTDSQSNRHLCNQVWEALNQAGLIVEREVTQLFDSEVGVFLADRFVKGQCPNPNCKAPNQYGDNCEVCGSTYSATELIDPVSLLSGAQPEVRSAMHLFVTLESLHSFLDQWTQTGDTLQPEIANYLREAFLGEPLRDWDVSRPAPYFGFEIPGTEGKHYWYVWFDAPIGYMASTWDWCQEHGQSFDRWWRDPETEIHHFIGKDITYFHTLFWPAMVRTGGFTLPKKIHIHGFLLVNGVKMSKREGTFIRARTYAEHLRPEYLRYFYAYKLSHRVDDIDLNLEEFKERIDGDLVGKFVNLASRTAKFAHKSGLSQKYPEDGGLFQAAAEAGQEIAAAYEACEYSKAMRRIMELADVANRYVEHHEPWKLAKNADRQGDLQDVCTVGLNLFRQLMIYLTPVLPEIAREAGELFSDPITRWDQAQQPLLGTAVSQYQHLMKRVDPKQIAVMIENSKEEASQTQSPQPGPSETSPAEAAFSATGSAQLSEAAAADSGEWLEKEPLQDQITIDDFGKIDLRVARVLAAEAVPEARKLLKLQVSLGGGQQRQIFAGIKAAYDPEKLVGSLVVIVANLAPRQMKFGLSEGMVVAAGPGGPDVFVLRPDEGAQPGQRVH